MSQWLGFTNQKLYQARLLLDQADQSSGKALVDALNESALYQMYDAWVSYLNELAGMAGYRKPVATLENLLEVTPLVTGEMTELRVLRADSYSWLVGFLSQVSAQAQPEPMGQGGVVQSGNLIAVAETSKPDVREWWQALSELIDSQRQNRQES